MFIIFKIQCMVVLGFVLAIGFFIASVLHGMFLDSKWLFLYHDKGLAEAAGLLAIVVPTWFAGRFLNRTAFATEMGWKVQYFAIVPLVMAGVFFFIPFKDNQEKTLIRMEDALDAQVRHAQQWHAKLEAHRKQLNTSDAAALASYQNALAAYNAEVEAIKARQSKVQEFRKKLGKE